MKHSLPAEGKDIHIIQPLFDDQGGEAKKVVHGRTEALNEELHGDHKHKAEITRPRISLPPNRPRSPLSVQQEWEQYSHSQED